jgi:D-alanyl-D-alanine carboxypeptidase (penicillin-binding protein 5/6)
MKRIIIIVFACIFVAQISWAQRAKLTVLSEEPYASALVLDADSGETLFEEHGGKIIYPASVLKLMDLLIILERIEQGTLRLDEMVQVTKEAAQMGGSQVFLDPKEQFSVEDLLYALIVQSANDAALALATHVAGSKGGFIALMNKRAKELGMKDSRFYSVHGLPPSAGQKPDETTARDLAILARELAQKPEVFTYTSTRERGFREDTFIMRTHNHLLASVDGCDGFKTGYFKAAGFSIVATARRGGVRIIAIVTGSKDRKIRDAKAAELIAKGFALVPQKPVVETVVSKPEDVPEDTKIKAANEQQQSLPSEKHKGTDSSPAPGGSWGMFFLGLGVGLALLGLLVVYRSRKRPKKYLRMR